MVVLHTELKDPKALVGGRGERAADGREDPVAPEAADGRDGPQRHVHGMGGDVFGASPMRHPGPVSGRPLPPGTGAAPAPRAGEDRESELSGTPGHELD